MTEIYLTKMILNSRCPQVRRDLGNPQDLHRTVSKGFPETNGSEAPRHKYKILHRLEVEKHLGKAVLFVQSIFKPDWSFLPKDYAETIQCKSVQEQYSAIENGKVLLFRLQANPTKRIGKSDELADPKFKPSDEKKIRRRVELRTDQEKIGWLRRKGEEVGFRLADIRFVPVPNITALENSKINFRKERNSPRITFGSVVFQGVLQVTDAAKFRDALIEGVGTGKAYGFGLLSIAPIKANQL